MRDIRAWTCTFEDCSSGLFEDRDSWFQHELEHHRRQWTCHECPNTIFTSKHAIEAHFQAIHPTLPVEALPTVIESSSRPVTEIEASACPLCDEWQQGLIEKATELGLATTRVVAPLHDFRRHLSHHLEQLALFAIPPNLENAMASGSDNNQHGKSSIGDIKDITDWNVEIDTLEPQDEAVAGFALALQDYEPVKERDEMRLTKGQTVIVSHRHEDGWLVATNPETLENGLVPEHCLQLSHDPRRDHERLEELRTEYGTLSQIPQEIVEQLPPGSRVLLQWQQLTLDPEEVAAISDYKFLDINGEEDSEYQRFFAGKPQTASTVNISGGLASSVSGMNSSTWRPASESSNYEKRPLSEAQQHRPTRQEYFKAVDGLAQQSGTARDRDRIVEGMGPGQSNQVLHPAVLARAQQMFVKMPEEQKRTMRAQLLAQMSDTQRNIYQQQNRDPVLSCCIKKAQELWDQRKQQMGAQQNPRMQQGRNLEEGRSALDEDYADRPSTLSEPPELTLTNLERDGTEAEPLEQSDKETFNSDASTRASSPDLSLTLMDRDRQATDTQSLENFETEDMTLRDKSTLTSRPNFFPCLFVVSGCDRHFSKRNEWKRHIQTQHVQVEYWRCQTCSEGESGSGQAKDFNRKDLLKQHISRVHSPQSEYPAARRGKAESDTQKRYEEAEAERCHKIIRQAPQASRCILCDRCFKGPDTWEQCLIHISTHLNIAARHGRTEDLDPQKWHRDHDLEQYLLNEGILMMRAEGIHELRSSTSVVEQPRATLDNLSDPSPNFEPLTTDQEQETQEERDLRAKSQMQTSELGKDHPSTLASMESLAELLLRRGRLEEAEELIQDVIEARQSGLGSQHPSILQSMAILALIYRYQRRLKQAEELAVTVLEGRKSMLGTDEPSTLTSMAELALIYRGQGRFDKAQDLQLKVLDRQRDLLGPRHPSTLESMSHLASMYRQREWWAQAEQLEREATDINKELLGMGYTDTFDRLAGLALTHEIQGRLKEATRLQEDIELMRQQRPVENHIDTRGSITDLALSSSEERHEEQGGETEHSVVGEGQGGAIGRDNKL